MNSKYGGMRIINKPTTIEDEACRAYANYAHTTLAWNARNNWKRITKTQTMCKAPSSHFLVTNEGHCDHLRKRIKVLKSFSHLEQALESEIGMPNSIE
jgi:hypothetical protein